MIVKASSGPIDLSSGGSRRASKSSKRSVRPDRAALVRAALSSPEFASKNPTAAARSGRDVWVEIAEEVLLKVNLADELGVSGPVIHGAFEPAETQFVKRAAKAGTHAPTSAQISAISQF